MRNGLTKTLAAVAVGLLACSAFASVPVVQEIPSPVITDDANPVTGSYLFIYADWLSPGSLNDYVSDDGPLSNIVWSFTADNGNYGVNGAQRLTGADSLVTPPAAKVINSQANETAAGEYDVDNNVLTPTVRDISLTPYHAASGTNPGQPAGTIVDTAQVTFWASDGTTAGATKRPMTFYTQEWDGTPAGGDRISATPTPPPVHVATLDFSTGTNNWTSATPLNVTYQTAGGLCISVSAVGQAGAAIGQWISPYGVIALTDNSVWRARATLTSTQTTAGQVPLWDIYFQNLNTDASGNPTAGGQAYIGDYLYVDQAGSANAVKGPSVGTNNFELWYTPSAVETPQWRNATSGIFTTTYDGQRDMRIVFRLLDAGGSYGGAAAANGQICLTNLSIDKFDLANIQSSTNLYTLSPLVVGINGVSVGNVGDGSVQDFNNNPLTITPSSTWSANIVNITPGDTNNPDISSGSYDPNAVPDNYPLPWTTGAVYQIVAELSAPNAAAETNGPDAITISFDSKTNELAGDSYATTGLSAVGSPKQVSTVGSTQNYMSIIGTGVVTNSAVVNANLLRWKMSILNSPSFGGTATGGLRIHSIKVNKITFFGQ